MKISSMVLVRIADMTSIKKVSRVKKVSTQEMGVQAIIPYSQIATPETYQGKYTVVPTTLTEQQILQIIAPTPKEIIKSRPGKGGGTWDYVPGWWFKKKLNFVFGFNWDFEILGERIDGDFITVKGKLIVKHPKTGQIQASKSDFGGSEIKYRKNTKQYLDISNDFKAATTDCLKRCAVQLGFCMDIYGKNEAKNEGYNVIENLPVKKPVLKGKVLDGEEVFDCQGNCGAVVTKQVADYSKKMFKGKIFCRECQAQQRGNK